MVRSHNQSARKRLVVRVLILQISLYSVVARLLALSLYTLLSCGKLFFFVREWSGARAKGWNVLFVIVSSTRDSWSEFRQVHLYL